MLHIVNENVTIESERVYRERNLPQKGAAKWQDVSEIFCHRRRIVFDRILGDRGIEG